MAWITPESLRNFVGNNKAGDEALLELAVDFACEKVEELCGPIAWAAVAGEVAEVAGSPEVCLRYRATRGLTAVADYLTSSAYTLTDWVADGQVLRRKSKAPIMVDLSVSYLTGYYDDTIIGATPPAWASTMALHIGQQWLRTTGKFRSSTDQPATHFLIPNVAIEAAKDHLLAPRIG